MHQSVVLSMMLTSAETTLIRKVYCECLAVRTHPKIVLNHLIPKKNCFSVSNAHLKMVPVI